MKTTKEEREAKVQERLTDAEVEHIYKMYVIWDFEPAYFRLARMAKELLDRRKNDPN